MIPYEFPKRLLYGDNPALIHPPCSHHATFKLLSLDNTVLSLSHWDDAQNLLTIPMTIKKYGISQKIIAQKISDVTV